MEDRLAALRLKESTIRHGSSVIFSSPRAYQNTNQGYDRGGFTSTQGAGGLEWAGHPNSTMTPNGFNPSNAASLDMEKQVLQRKREANTRL
jgi:hypothetical protein